MVQVALARNTKLRNEKLEKEKQEKERLKALKENNEEEYFRLLKSGKNDRLMTLLNQTDSYLQQIGALINKQQQQISEDLPSTPRRKKKKDGEGDATAEEAAPGGDAANDASAEPAAAQSEVASEAEDKQPEPDDREVEKDAPKAVDPWNFEETSIKAGEEADEIMELDDEEVEGAEGEDDQTLTQLRKRKDEYYTLAHGVMEEITEQPQMLVGGKLKEYQMHGLKWLVSLHNNNLNGILADEMGLGKTIQTIALLAYLYESKGEHGPWLIIVPLSTVSNWSNEFGKWCPDLKLVVYKGTPGERKRLMAQDIGEGDFNVVLTTYDYAMRDKTALTRPYKGFRSWKYIIVDEGHRMKNSSCKLAQILGTQYQSKNRVLLTGTPLQNGIPELWALLNFLLPTIFNSVDNFENWFAAPLANTGEKVELTEEETILIVNRLHQVLRPFLLRRLKSEVMGQLPEKVEKIVKIDLSGWQKKFYHDIRERGRTEADPTTGKPGSRSLMNTLMQLRKVVNHPYLFLTEWNIDEDIVRSSGKFRVLDNILPKLHRTGHRVLLFSQMTSCMDVIEDYFGFRGYRFVRLDGATKADDRQERMAQFLVDRDIFVFLLSTRAGGLGLNLQSADTVIIFDSDWNPQMDLQAQDRAHRIGQQQEVRVLRFVTCSAVEEQILSRATEKLRLDAKVIQAGKFNNKSTNQDRKEALRAVLEEDNEDYDEEGVATDEQINDMLARNEDEKQLFDKMDQGNAEPYERYNYTIPPLFALGEAPEWYQTMQLENDDGKASEESEDDLLEMGRGARRKSEVRYTEMSEREFERLCREGAPDGTEAQKKQRPARVRKKRRRDEDESLSDDDDGAWQQLASKLMPAYQAVYDLKDEAGDQVCELFVKLPTRKELPYYYTIISNPIDLLTIESRLKGKRKPYQNASDFKADMELMFKNAESFNLEGSEIYNSSLQLRKVFSTAMASLADPQDGGMSMVIEQHPAEVNAPARKTQLEHDDGDNTLPERADEPMEVEEAEVPTDIVHDVPDKSDSDEEV